ncbi:MAG: glutathione S-transferase family protein [Bosea sp.]|uniref:glutathione S-transferase N-terminal domain-containing protein n=1 Tax=Bosea sp. (in: a-proteobacteria) TaxID=1871050 RepID=UPI0010F95BED|nr:glutathione S-transferase family protein [Bosea sp. (in: a-proteobacteria)]MCP4734852.1 glutathione S-transferase family protein [Bosea sp. (in: a-proteobacteria)]
MTDLIATPRLLHWSPRSPFVRKVLIAAHERGLADSFERVRTVVHPEAPHEGLFEDNPLNKLPTLVLSDGSSLYDSRVICEYLDLIGDAAPLFPPTGAHRLAALRDQALGDGILDFALVWLLERTKPEAMQSERLIAAFQRKLAAALDRLERDAGALAARPFDIGHVSIGAALLYLDFRFPSEAWREGRPAIADWHARFAERPSVIANPAIAD